MDTYPEPVAGPSSGYLYSDQAVVERNNVLNELVEEQPMEESTEGADGEAQQYFLVTLLSKTKTKIAVKKQKFLEIKKKRRQKYKLNKLKKHPKRQWPIPPREPGMVTRKKVQKNIMEESKCKQRIVLDLDYIDLLNIEDLYKCSNQILKCYTLNRRMENPMQFYICNYFGKIKNIMARHYGSEFWDIYYAEEPIVEMFHKKDMVYLTSDSSNVLDSLDESKVYIIGGLVDLNFQKGASLKVAENLGIAHAQLPINKYINMKTRNVLSINHVFEIITKVVSGIPWKEALVTTLPKRKIFSVMDEEEGSSSSKLEESMRMDVEESNSQGTEEMYYLPELNQTIF